MAVQTEAKPISLKKIEDWPTPAQAIEIAKANLGKDDWLTASKAITERVHGGIIGVAARSSSTVIGENRAPVPRGPILIPGVYWHHLGESGSNFWTGHVRFYLPNPNYREGAITLRCFGLRLNPEQMRVEFPAAPVQPARDPAPAKHAGGAPRKTFWDDLLIEMFRRIWEGEFKPNRQADIEKAMLDWAAEKGFDLGPTSVKAPAKKLLVAYNATHLR